MAQILSNLPVGAKVKFGKYAVGSETPQEVVWLVAAKEHVSTPAYPVNSITLITEKIIDLKAFDAREPQNGGNARIYGNDKYSISNLDQWLNSDASAGQWYSSKHTYDMSPQKDYLTTEAKAGYDTRSGFLNAFTDMEKAAILTTPIRVALAGTDGQYEDISRKVFVPSAGDLGYRVSNGAVDGSKWSYFSNNSVLAGLTTQAFTYAASTSKPSSASETWHYWTRSPYPTTASKLQCMGSGGGFEQFFAYSAFVGVRPAMNVSSTLMVSDTLDDTGCYTMVWNYAPTIPPSLNVPTTIFAEQSTAISWGKSTDPNGDAVTYILECSYGGADWGILYSGANTSYSHTIPYGETNSVQYRVRAWDGLVGSAYIESSVRTVINNTAPSIGGTDSNLGIKSTGFELNYVVTDKENDSVSVIELIDGREIRSYVATLGKSYSISITGLEWLRLSNGSHTLSIVARDSYMSTTRSYVFTKSVDKLVVQNSTPMTASSMPTRMIVSVTRNIPTDAIFKVEVCNNGFDTSPTWEDATDTLTNGLVHLFTNTSKTASQWGVSIRISVDRNNAQGACYISAIGGNFE